MANSNNLKIPLARIAEIWRKAGYPKPLSLFMENMHKFNTESTLEVKEDSASKIDVCHAKSLPKPNNAICLYSIGLKSLSLYKPPTYNDYRDNDDITTLGVVIDASFTVLDE